MRKFWWKLELSFPNFHMDEIKIKLDARPNLDGKEKKGFTTTFFTDMEAQLPKGFWDLLAETYDGVKTTGSGTLRLYCPTSWEDKSPFLLETWDFTGLKPETISFNLDHDILNVVDWVYEDVKYTSMTPVIQPLPPSTASGDQIMKMGIGKIGQSRGRDSNP